jgi:hypothetical protein
VMVWTIHALGVVGCCRVHVGAGVVLSVQVSNGLLSGLLHHTPYMYKLWSGSMWL